MNSKLSRPGCCVVTLVLLSCSLVGCRAGDPVKTGGTDAEAATANDSSGADTPETDGGEHSETIRFEASAGVGRSPENNSAPVDELAAGFNNAGFQLWLAQSVNKNFVFSPVSIGHALLMARGAANDETGAAIDAAFGLPAGISAHEAWNAADIAIAAAANAEEEVTIRIADRIWPRLDVNPDQGWIDLLASEHGASVRALDFANDASGSRDIINEWVSEQTETLIPELLPEGFLQPSTVLVLTDAIYFKARWQTVFGKYGSVMDSFTLLDGSTKDIELLRELELSDRRGVGDGFVGAEIPYVGRELSMLLIVPDEGRFEEIRGKLDQSFIDGIDDSFGTGPFELLMPAWTTNTNLNLLPWLTEFGAAPGSYPKITPGAFLGGAVHGADIAVDEWGTVAAAATGLAFDESGAAAPQLIVKADRPFLYLIRHRASGMVLFAGQVVDP